MCMLHLCFVCRGLKTAASGSSTDLVEHDGLEFHASIDSGLHSCDTDSPMFGKHSL